MTRKNALSLIALMLCAALLFGACAAPKAEEVVASPGVLARYQGKIYYINGVGNLDLITDRYNVSLGALCRMNEDGTQREIIVPVCVAVFALTDRGIYVISGDKEKNMELAFCNFDGSDYTSLTSMTEGVFLAEPPYLYFSNNGLFRQNNAGGERSQLIKETFTTAAKVGDRIYYTVEGEGLKSVDSAGKNPQTDAAGAFHIISSKNGRLYYLSTEDGRLLSRAPESEKVTVEIFTAYAEYLLFPEENLCIAAGTEENPGLFTVNLSSGETVRLTENTARSQAKEGNWVYYSNVQDSGYIYRINLETKENQLVSASVPLQEPLAIMDGWLYYVSVNEGSKNFRIHLETGVRERIFID